MKYAILFIFLFVSITSYAQDEKEIPKDYESAIVIDHVVSTKFLQPMMGLMYSTEIFDEDYIFSLQARFGYLLGLDNSLKKNNYFIAQSAIIFNVDKKISIGTYWMNFQGITPRKRLGAAQLVTSKNEDTDIGYRSPLSLFTRINVNTIVKTGFLSNSQLYFEANYYVIDNLPAFRITYTQKLYLTHKR